VGLIRAAERLRSPTAGGWEGGREGLPRADARVHTRIREAIDRPLDDFTWRDLRR